MWSLTKYVSSVGLGMYFAPWISPRHLEVLQLHENGWDMSHSVEG